MMLFLKSLVADHLPKLIAGALAAVLVAGVVAWIAAREREEIRVENTLVESGRKEVTIEQQERTLENVKKANDAERAPTLDDRERVRQKYDRCASDPAACQ